MKTQASAFLLGCAALLATALPARAQFLTNTVEHLAFTDELAVYDVRLGDEHAIVENGLVVPAVDPSRDLALVERLEREKLALAFRVGVLQTQVELLSRRLAALEVAAPAAEAPLGRTATTARARRR